MPQQEDVIRQAVLMGLFPTEEDAMAEATRLFKLTYAQALWADDKSAHSVSEWKSFLEQFIKAHRHVKTTAFDDSRESIYEDRIK